MPAKSKTFKVMISGKSYENGVQKNFKPVPVGRRNRGFGYQVTYELTEPELKNLVDIMADIQAPVEGDAPLDLVEAVTNDLKRFPPEAGL